MAVCSGGGKVFAIGGNGQTAVMDASTGVAVLYTSPGWFPDANSAYSGEYLYNGQDKACYYGGLAYYGAKNSNGYQPQMICTISTTGATASYSAGYTSNNSGYWQYEEMTWFSMLAVGNYVHGTFGYPYNGASWFIKMDLTTKSITSDINTRLGGVGGNKLYVPSGATLNEYNDDGSSTGSSWVLPSAPISLGTTSGNVIWWNASAGMVWFDYTTNARGFVASTPGAGFPASSRRPVILGAVAYWMHSDNTKMVAFNMLTGQWKLDDLATSRTRRFGIGVGNGKLWIPTTVTPP